MADAFRVICVCTGNVCRSPAAERLLAHALGPSVTPSSAGIQALIGQPISAPMDALIAEVGADPAGFEARVLTEAQLREADLVLAMTRAHRSAIVELAPAAVRRCFTLREYARLLGQLPPTALPDGSPGERGPRLDPAGCCSPTSVDPTRRRHRRPPTAAGTPPTGSPSTRSGPRRTRSVACSPPAGRPTRISRRDSGRRSRPWRHSSAP